MSSEGPVPDGGQAHTPPSRSHGAEGEPVPPANGPVPARAGLSTFTIEGRAAPGLFVVGWLATIVGLGIALIGFLSPSGLLLYVLGPTILSVGLIAGAGNQAIERRARGEAYAGPSPYLVFALTISATFAIVSVIGVALSFVVDQASISQELLALILVAIQASIFVGVIRLTVVGTDALSWREMGWSRLDGSAARNWLLGAATALPIIFVTAILADVLVSIFHVVPESPLPPTGTGVGLGLELIAGALIAPLAEEALFRGFAVTAWERSFGARGAIIRSSLLFALAHVINTSGDSSTIVGIVVIGFATRLPVAFMLGWLFARSRSIWTPVGLHMTFNGILLILGAISISTGTGTGGG